MGVQGKQKYKSSLCLCDNKSLENRRHEGKYTELNKYGENYPRNK